MNRIERITQLLQQAFAPQRLEVLDDSAKHAGHAGATPGEQTHITIRIQSKALHGLPRVKAHQAIYKLLAEELRTGLHAVAIEVLT